MRNASEKRIAFCKTLLRTTAPESPEFAIAHHQKRVAETFIDLQQQRLVADYDHAQPWTRTEALIQVNAAVSAFASWKAIRETGIAQEYLISMLVKDR